MALTINTNIMALNTQNQLSKSSSMMATAMERLSSGLRINSAKDDAAGLAIADRFTTQINGLNQAIRNANDGISLSQTAEGAMSEMSNILQRMRELAVQSINDTNTASDRLALQNEVDQLYSELERIATTTQFNGQNVLDGTLRSSTFQIGANAGQTLDVSLESVTTQKLGLNGYTALGELNSGRVTDTDISGGNQIAADDILINGESAFASATGAASNNAFYLAEGINGNSGVTGVTAEAYNTVSTKALSDGITLVARINGTDVGAGSAEELVDVINRDVAGVVAVLNVDNSITLSNDTGADITIADNSQTSSNTMGVANDTYAGFLALESADGSAITIEANIDASGTIADVQLLGFNQSTGSSLVTGAAVTTDVLAESDDIEINGVQIGASDGSSAADKATAINLVSDQTGVQASGFTETTFVLNLAQALGGANDDFNINGTDVTISTVTNLEDLVDAVNTAGIQGIVASSNDDGALVLTSSTGLDITVTQDTGVTNLITSGVNQSGDTWVSGTALKGNLTLENELGGDVILSGADVGFLGLTEQGGSEDVVGSGLDITSAKNAEVALNRIDDALEVLNNARSELGAVQNRFESTISNLSNVAQNLTAARGRIVDADFAMETTSLSKAQILQQAGTAMLAQANASQQNVLSLLS